jgi:hypothetical protein
MLSYLGIHINFNMIAWYTSFQTEPLKTAMFRALAPGTSQHRSPSAILVDVHGSRRYFIHIPRIDLEKALTVWEKEDMVSGGLDPTLDAILEPQYNCSFILDKESLPFRPIFVLLAPGIRCDL